MTMRRTDNPGWVNALLDLPYTWLLVRILLTSAFWIGGLTKLIDFPGAVSEQEHFGLHPAWLFATLTIAVELLGSLLIISGHGIWLGAGMLAVFTALATLIAHAFWTLQGQEQQMAINAFFEHIGLIAGLAAVTLHARHASHVTTPSEH